jgi:hypothetical protein
MVSSGSYHGLTMFCLLTIVYEEACLHVVYYCARNETSSQKQSREKITCNHCMLLFCVSEVLLSPNKSG